MILYLFLVFKNMEFQTCMCKVVDISECIVMLNAKLAIAAVVTESYVLNLQNNQELKCPN